MRVEGKTVVVVALLATVVLTVGFLLASVRSDHEVAEIESNDHLPPVPSSESGQANPGNRHVVKQPKSSRATMSDEATVLAAYTAGTIDQLDALAVVARGDLAFDLDYLKYRANVFCQDLYARRQSGKREGTFLEVVQIGQTRGDPVSPEQVASAKWVDRKREQFCTRGVAQHDVAVVDEAEAARLAGVGALADAIAMAEAEAVDPDDPPKGEELDPVRANLLELMKSTASPTVYRMAAQLLAGDTRLGNWWTPPGMPRSFPVLSEINQADANQWRSVGGEIAFCQLAGGACGPDTLTTILSCMPANCRPGETLLAYLRRTQSPQTMEQAQAYANAMLAQRRSTGP